MPSTAMAVMSPLCILPEIGVTRGNTHFAFSDLNNIEIAGLISECLNKKGFDEQPGGWIDRAGSRCRGPTLGT